MRCALLFGLLAMVGCHGSSGTPVKIVVPNDFSGELRIVKDSKNGSPLVKREGEYIFDVPDTGVLFVKDDSPFHAWHRQVFVYRDGTFPEVEDGVSYAGNKGNEASADFDGAYHEWHVKKKGK